MGETPARKVEKCLQSNNVPSQATSPTHTRTPPFKGRERSSESVENGPSPEGTARNRRTTAPRSNTSSSTDSLHSPDRHTLFNLDRSEKKTVASPALSILIEERSWNKVLSHLKSNPSDAAIDLTAHNFDDGTNLPLHEALKYQPPVDVVRALLKAHPDSISTKGRWGYLPLHVACTTGVSSDLVSLLIQSKPATVRTRESSGKLPLHLACRWGASAKVIETILTNHPEGIYVRDADGNSPMEYLENNSTVTDKAEVIKVLKNGPSYCAVSKAAMARSKSEADAKIHGMVEVHKAHVEKMDEVYDAHRAQSERELNKEKQTVAKLKERIAELESVLEEEKERSREEADALQDGMDEQRRIATAATEKLEQVERELAEERLKAKEVEEVSQVKREEQQNALVALNDASQMLLLKYKESEASKEAMTKQIVEIEAAHDKSMRDMTLKLDCLVDLVEHWSVDQETVRKALSTQDTALKSIVSSHAALIEGVDGQQRKVREAVGQFQGLFRIAADSGLEPRSKLNGGEPQEGGDVDISHCSTLTASTVDDAEWKAVMTDESFETVEHDSKKETKNDGVPRRSNPLRARKKKRSEQGSMNGYTDVVGARNSTQQQKKE